MAQLIKLKRGSLESLSAVTGSLQKGEILIASGSTNLTASNGNSLVFAVPENGQAQATNRFLIGDAAPNTFASSTYNGLVKGVPYYASGSSTLYLLGSDGNDVINLEGNIQPFSTSISTRLSEIGVVSGSLISSASAAAVADVNQNSFTASAAGRLVNLEATSASVNTSVSALNSFTTSAADTFTEIGVVSGSLISSASAAKSTNDTQDGRLNNLESTSASVNTSVASINSVTSSQLTQNSALATITGSLISSASSQSGRIGTLETFSSDFNNAFELTGSNVVVLGDLTVKGTTTTVDSTTIQLGDNIIELNGSGVANGGLLVKDNTSPNTVSGSLLWDSTNDYWKAGAVGAESKLLRADGDSVVSGSSQITISNTTGYGDFSGSVSASIAAVVANVGSDVGVSITNLNSFSSSTLGRLTNIESFSGSANDRFTEIGVVSGSLIASASAAKTTNDLQDGKLTNLELTSASVNTSVSALNSFSSSQLTQNTALATISGSLISSASAAKTTNDSQDVSITNLNSFSGSQLTQNSALATISGSLISSASAAKTANDSQDVSITNINSFSSSVLTQLTQIGVVSGSLIASASNSDSRLDTLEGSGVIQGVGQSDNVVFATATTTGDVVIGGNLVVQGETVTLNTSQLVVEDKLITLASGSTSSAAADGAGIEIAGANANFVYQHATTAFTSSVALIAPAVTASVNLGTAAGSTKRIVFRNVTGNLELVPTASVSGDVLQWNGSDFVMSNTIDAGTF